METNIVTENMANLLKYWDRQPKQTIWTLAPGEVEALAYHGLIAKPLAGETGVMRRCTVTALNVDELIKELGR